MSHIACFRGGVDYAALHALAEGEDDGAFDADVRDLLASFQEAVVDILAGKLVRAADRLGVRYLAASGGVSLNRRLRGRSVNWTKPPPACARLKTGSNVSPNFPMQRQTTPR